MMMPPRALAGQLLVGGFPGTELGGAMKTALAREERAGVILFARNLGEPEQVLEMTRSIAEATKGARSGPTGLPPIVAVDQEGGRVARLKGPFLRVPPMLELSAAGRDLFRNVGAAQGRELRAAGFTVDFAPVLDVHTRAENPIIGDRAFGTTAERVIENALAYAEGLREGEIVACGKHYPGHGDTTTDSHLELPCVNKDRAGLDQMELLPFVAAARAGLPSLMSAHVVYPALDGERCATLSHRIATELLRNELGYEGVLFSDDLEMKAIALSVEDASIGAILAGCDLLLICSKEDLQERAIDALAAEIERSTAFRQRAEAAARRAATIRTHVPRPAASLEELRTVFRASDDVREALVRAAASGTAGAK